VIYPANATRSYTGWPAATPAPGTYIAMVDLTSSGETTVGTLNGGEHWEVDLVYYIPEGTAAATYTAHVQLASEP
ncbi:MAG: hypothetical protein LRS49_00200, partial [Desulfurococcales archaeon]|nr:hypothetical protein [Desulfurococcales archaeon]